VYFQIPSDDIERSKEFYNQLSGWKIDKSPESNTPVGMENWAVTTTDDKGNQALAGEMSKRAMPQQQITMRFASIQKTTIELCNALNPSILWTQESIQEFLILPLIQ
jgi:predicted enzyme related to lactoylglutathione lyase